MPSTSFFRTLSVEWTVAFFLSYQGVVVPRVMPFPVPDWRFKDDPFFLVPLVPVFLNVYAEFDFRSWGLVGTRTVLIPAPLCFFVP